MSEPDKVSCVTVSFVPHDADRETCVYRWNLLEKSIASYVAQTYANREMLIACGPPQYFNFVRAMVKSMDRSDVRVINASNCSTLGEYRNRTLEDARGDYLCQWDDDDIYHPQRISKQMFAIATCGAHGALLLDYLHWFVQANRLYLEDWYDHAGQTGLPGSILIKKDNAQCYDPQLLIHEDTAFCRQLWANKARIALIRGQGYLYTYRFHGRNLFAERHHDYCVRRFSTSGEALWAILPHLDRLYELQPDFPGQLWTRDGPFLSEGELQPLPRRYTVLCADTSYFDPLQMSPRDGVLHGVVQGVTFTDS